MTSTAPGRTHRIDVHHHVVTEWNPVFAMHLGQLCTLWSVDNALRVMDENEIRVAMLSPVALPRSKEVSTFMAPARDEPLGHIDPIREHMRKATRQANHQVAELAAAHPDRFGFFASLTVHDAEDAVQEAAYAFDVLGADGIFLPTNLGEKYLGDDLFDPLFAELDRRQAVAFIHPMPLPCPLVSGVPAHVADFLLSTVRAATNLVHKGTTCRYPNVKLILTHAGGFLPYAVQRLSRTLASTDATRSQEDFLREYQGFYFDVALASAPVAISGLLAFADPTHVLYGSDFPFCQPNDVEFFTRQLDGIELDLRLHQAINFGNAEALFPRLRSSTDRQPAG